MRDRLTPAELRNRAGLTQEEAAIALRKSVGTISKWERFEKRPRLSFSEVKRIMLVYGCSLDDLIEAFDRVNPDEV